MPDLGAQAGEDHRRPNNPVHLSSVKRGSETALACLLGEVFTRKEDKEGACVGDRAMVQRRPAALEEECDSVCVRKR